jgi:hypothetical protein
MKRATSSLVEPLPACGVLAIDPLFKIVHACLGALALLRGSPARNPDGTDNKTPKKGGGKLALTAAVSQARGIFVKYPSYQLHG